MYGGITVNGADRRLIYAYAIISAVMLCGGAVVSRRTPVPFAPRVNVRWSEGLPEADRVTLERRFGLLQGRHDDGATWTYDVTDTSVAAVTSLVRDPAVKDTHFIDRTTGVIDREAPRGTTSLRQSGVASFVNSRLFTWFMLFWFSSLLVSGTCLAARREASLD